MAVAVIAQIDDVVVARAIVADQRRHHGKAVLVEDDLVAFAVRVVDDRHLRGETRNRQVLAIEIGYGDVILARALLDRIEAGVRVLLQPVEEGEIVLIAVVVAIAEEADAEIVVLEKEAAEVRREGLDADAHGIEIVALRDVADVVIDERFLHAEEIVETVGEVARD